MSRSLEPRLIIETSARLHLRVAERFPGSGLAKLAGDLEGIAREAEIRGSRIARPHAGLRGASWLLTAALVAGVPYALSRMGFSFSSRAGFDFLQGVEAAANLTLLFGAAIVSVWKFEESLRRRRALETVYELKSLAHVIDMHQLTKHPEPPSRLLPSTKSSPTRTLSGLELARYLDYCGEMLSVVGKIAALYAQNLQDPVVLDAVDGVEDLTTGLSRKIWQKIAVLPDGPDPLSRA